MALKKIHFLKDRFVFDDYESGLYFDVCPVKRPSGDENVFNAAIAAANNSISETEPDMQNWKPTLLLTDAQVYAIPESWRNIFAAKSYLLLYKSGFSGSSLPKNPWFELGSGGIVCDPTGAHKDWVYYTNYTADGLGHRFRRVSKEEVDAYKYTEPTSTTPTDDSSGDMGDTTTPTTTVTTVSGGLFPLNSVTTIDWAYMTDKVVPIRITVLPVS